MRDDSNPQPVLNNQQLDSITCKMILSNRVRKKLFLNEKVYVYVRIVFRLPPRGHSRVHNVDTIE